MNKTTIVGIVSLLAGVLAFFGINLDEAAQQTLVEAVSAVVAGVGVIVAAFGSYKADKNAASDTENQKGK